jgi:microbial collagenase
MSLSRNTLYFTALLATSPSLGARADQSADPAADQQGRLKQAPMPHQRQSLPPTAEQSQFKLPATTSHATTCCQGAAQPAESTTGHA